MAFVILGSIIAFLWIDSSEFLDPFSGSDWCEAVIKGKLQAPSVLLVWNCYDRGQFCNWAFALGTLFSAIAAGLGLAIWAATAFLMQVLVLNK